MKNCRNSFQLDETMVRLLKLVPSSDAGRLEPSHQGLWKALKALDAINLPHLSDSKSFDPSLCKEHIHNEMFSSVQRRRKLVISYVLFSLISHYRFGLLSTQWFKVPLRSRQRSPQLCIILFRFVRLESYYNCSGELDKNCGWRFHYML
jgi:hypothetical protein